jgi:hypothetical protein
MAVVRQGLRFGIRSHVARRALLINGLGHAKLPDMSQKSG